ncbi:hypothetical protein HJ590_05460 [Naumannella sp. ID2617S]|nr:hypothetical protein [Naumannella sp. ID2617S]
MSIEGGGMDEQERLRAALHRVHGADAEPLDADAIMTNARLRQARHRARVLGVTAVLALVVLAGVLLPRILPGQQASSTGGSAESGPQAAAPARTSGPTPQSATPGAAATRSDKSAQGSDQLQVRGGQWCLTGPTPSCRPLTQTRVEFDRRGVRIVAVLAPAGTTKVEPVRPGGPAPTVLLSTGEETRLVVLRPAATPEPVRAVAADGRVLATLE